MLRSAPPPTSGLRRSHTGGCSSPAALVFTYVVEVLIPNPCPGGRSKHWKVATEGLAMLSPDCGFGKVNIRAEGER